MLILYVLLISTITVFTVFTPNAKLTTPPTLSVNTTSPTTIPTTSPTTPPTVSPTTTPTSSPTISPTTTPTSSPTISPTTTPTSSPTNPPTSSPTTPPTSSPTNPPTISPTNAPIIPPTASPSSSPVCVYNTQTDITWIIDASAGSQNNNVYPRFLEFIQNFTATKAPAMSPTGTRQAFVAFSGPNVFVGGTDTIGSTVLYSDAASTNAAQFTTSVDAATAPFPGSTNTVGAVDFVKTDMLFPGDLRPGSRRITVLLQEDRPNDDYGQRLQIYADQAEASVDALKAEDNTQFAFIQINEFTYPPNWFENQADYMYTVNYDNMDSILDTRFLCIP